MFLGLQLSLTAGEEVDIEYEVDGWFYVSIMKYNLYFILVYLKATMLSDNLLSLLLQVKKKRPGRDGKMAGLVPVLYVNQSWFCGVLNLTRKFDCSHLSVWLHRCIPTSWHALRVLHRIPHFLQRGLHDISINWFCSWILELVCSLTSLHPYDVCFVIH